jgi:uncharacterized cupredoxin-like copper-binding protein
MSWKRLAAGLLVLTLFVSCSSSDGAPVRLEEYTISVADSEVPSGPVSFRAENLGAIEHELVVLRTNLDPDDLPVKDSEARTNARGIREVGATKRIHAGEEEILALRLRPGRYALICNVPGHYQSGMRTGLRVL